MRTSFNLTLFIANEDYIIVVTFNPKNIHIKLHRTIIDGFHWQHTVTNIIYDLWDWDA